MRLFLEFEKVKFNELTWWIWILRVKFPRDRYYLELKTKDRMLEKGKKIA